MPKAGTPSGHDGVADGLLELTLRDGRVVREQLAAHAACTELCSALATQLESTDMVCKMTACGYGTCLAAMTHLEENDRAVAAAGCTCRVTKGSYVEQPCSALPPGRSAADALSFSG